MTRTDRLFFALWPNTDIAKLIHDTAGAYKSKTQGRRIVEDQLHLTLVFLGSLDATLLPCVKEVADNISLSPFELCMDLPGYFPQPQVAWLGMKSVPLALQTLQVQLGNGLQQHCQIQTDKRAYVPHITLWRKIKQVELPRNISAVNWQVQSFVLASSRTYAEGAQYQILQEWRLNSNQD